MKLPAALESLKNRPDVTFIEFSTEDTAPVVTEGFQDEDIQKMSSDHLRKELLNCNNQEAVLSTQLAELRKRRNSLNNLLQRKSEIERYGLHYRP